MKSLKRLFGRKTTRKANSRRLPFRISRPIGYASHVERLEDRTLLASNILASLESSVNNPNDTTELVLNIGAGSSPTLGFEVRASASSSFNPAAIQILDANTNAVIPLNLAENDHQGPNSLVLATLNPGEYKILVQGQTPDTGGFIIDVFLPGDMDGSGTVSQSELEHATAAYYQSNFGYNHFTAQLIQQLGLNPSANYYSEELDGDKDGDIDNHDLQMVTGNQGLPPIQLELIGDQDAPAVDAGLEVDSGISDSDGVSNELTILGTVTDESLITQFKVALDGGSFVDIFGELSGGANGGTFTLTRGWLETNLNSGASLEGGMHTLHFMTADEHGNLSSAGMFDVNFELDTVAPSVTGTPIGDQNLNEDFTPVNLGALSTYFNQNGGTPLNFHVDSITDAIVDVDFSTGDLILNSILDANGMTDIVIQAIDVAGNAVLSNTFTVTINALNDPPVAVDGDATAYEDFLNNFPAPGVLAFVTDVENDTLTVTEVNGSAVNVAMPITIGSGGELNVAADGSFTFDPKGLYEYLAAGESTTENFTYTVSDGNGGTDTATVTITIHGVNDPPTVSAAVTTMATEDDSNFSLDLLTNASDPDTTDMLNVSSLMLTGGDDGGVTVNGNQLDIDPSAYNYLAFGESAVITYSYNVIDGEGGVVAQTATITITGVNDSPAVSAAVSTMATEDDADFSLDLLTNASDPDTTDMLNVSNLMLTGGDDSGVTVNGNQLDIDPSAYNYLAFGESAVITYSYNVIDGEGGVVAQTATITITGVNDSPAVSAAVTTTVTEDDADFSLDLLTNASDPDTTDMLNVSNLMLTGGDDSGVTVNGNQLDIDPSAYNYLAFGESAVITYSYNVIDGEGGVVAQTATITITGVNDSPAVSAAVSTMATEDDADFSLDLLTNASDPDTTDMLNVSSLMLTGGDDSGVTVNGNQLDIDPSAYSYLAFGESAVITYSYNVIDGEGGVVAQTATITITGVNDSPAVSAAVSTMATEDDADFSLDLLTNASDPDTTDMLNVSSLMLTGGDDSGVTVNGNQLDIDPSAYNYLAFGESAVITYSYNVIDGEGGVVAQTATITITGVNDSPAVSAAVTTTVTEDDADFSLDLLTNASDPDTTDMLNVSNLMLTGGDDGGVTVNGNQLDIDPSAYNYLAFGESAVITYSYNVIDGEGGVVAQTATITITGVNDSPAVSAAVTTTVTEDDADFSLDLLTNASDPDTTDMLNVSNLMLTGGDDSGVTVNGNQLDIDPSAYNYLAFGESAVITYSYNVIDGEGGVVAQTATITITGVNDSPAVSAAVTTTVTEDDADFSLDLLTNASDPDTTDMLNVSNLMLTGGDDSGVTVNGNQLDIDPSAYNYLAFGESAVITYSYNVIDGEGGVVAQTATITITGVNDSPAVSAAVTTTVTEDDADFSLDLLTNASDPDTTDMLNVSNLMLTGGDDSGVTVNGNQLDIDPSAYNYLAFGESAVITYSYNVIDGEGGVVAQTATITITGVNDSPAVSAAVSTMATEDDADFSLDLLTNASDPDTTDMLNVSSLMLTGGDDGGVTVNGNQLDIDPSAYNYLAFGESAVITYSYNVIDGEGGVVAQTATITITGVNDPPVAQADAFDVNKDFVFNGSVFADNGSGADSDPDASDTFMVSEVENSAMNVNAQIVLSTWGALLTLNDDGTFNYDPNGMFSHLSGTATETDTFTYQISDGDGGFDTATVTLTISANQLPIANSDNAGSTGEDTPLNGINVLGNDSDPDGDDNNLFVSGLPSMTSAGGAMLALNGNLINYDPTGAFDYLAVGEMTTDTFTYTIQDERGGEDTGTVTVTIIGANDGPTVSAAVTSMVTEDDANYSLNLLTNASDPDTTDMLNVDSLMLTGGDDSGVTVNGNQLDIDPSAYNYLAFGESAVITYSYNVIDGEGGVIAQTATITITGVNDPPTVSMAVLSLPTEDDVAFNLDLLSNSSDVDATDILMVSNLMKTSGDDSGITINGNSLDIDPSVYNSLAAGETAVIEYSYNVVDGKGGSVAQTATITINGVNDAPTVSMATVTSTVTEDDASYSLDLLVNASDVDTTDILMVSNLVKFSGNNTGITVNGNQLDIDPSAYDFLAVGESAVIVYTYDVIDGNGGSVPQSATITITGVNDSPAVSAAVTTTVTEDDADFSLDLLTNASDPDTTDMLNVSSLMLTGGDDSGVTVNGNQLDIDPSAYNYLAFGESAVITYSYNVIDGEGGVVAQTATITITGVNDSPAVSAAVTTTVTEDDADFSLDLLTNASDPDTTDMLNVSNLMLTGGDDSGVTVNGNQLDIDPSAYNYLAFGESAVITYSYNVIDGEGGVVAQTATITITGVNDSPAVSAAVSTMATEDDADFSLDLLTNASDPDTTDMLNVSSLMLTGGDDSGVTVNGNQLDIDPSAYNYLAFGESAVITYSYNVIDGEGGVVAQTATITITGVNDSPAVSAAVSTMATEDDADFSLDLLTNASDPDTTDMLNVSSLMLTGGDDSGVTVNGNQLDIDPSAYNYLAFGESAVITYSYNVIDGEGGVVAQTATITITGVNDSPAVSAAVTTTVTEDDADFSLDLLTNASDPDTTDMLNVSNLMLTGGDDSGVTVNGNQLDIDPSAYNYLAFGESAVITYSYNVIDGEGGVVAQTAMITITGVNDSPAVSAAVSTMATEDDANFSLDLLTNATDVDQSDTLSVLNLMQTNAGDIGGITMDTASSWTIDPSYYNDLAFDESEVITYSYDVSDGNGGTVSQTLTITISGVNDAPVAQADGFSTGEDTVLVGGDVFADNGNGADSDDDLSDSFTVTGISEGMTSGTVGDPFVLSSGATVTLTSGGNFDYNPVGAFDFLAVGETATDEFTYTISDGNGGTDTATVTITITGVNDPVMAADDGVTTTKDTPLNFDVRLDNGNGPDTDADASDTLSVIEITDPVLGTTTATVGMEIPLESGATVTLQADGTLVYDPNGMFPDLFEPTDFDTDIFTYKITDGDTTDTATVTVTVTGSNELLMLTDVPLENISRDGLTPETIDLDLHFNDPDVGDTVTYMVEAHVEGGMAGDALPANFWANVAISGSDLNITYTDYDSEQVRLPLVITVTAHSDDTLSDDVTSTFTLTPVPQATVDIRLIARDVESSGRDFTSFRAELNVGTVVLDELGGARFQLVNGLQDLTYSIYLGDYDLDVDGTANGDSTDDLKELRIIDTTNDDVLFTIFSNSSAHDNPTIDSVNDILTGTWTLGEGLSSAIIDKLYDGVLAVEVIENTGGAGTPSIASGGNIVVSPEVADVTDLPSSISQVAVGDQYVVEIWISDQLAQVLAGQSTTTAGLSSILMDMMWDVADTSLVEDLFTIDTSAFGFLTTVLDVDAPGGVLNDISATSVLPDLVSNGYGRVGYAVFSADNVADDVDFMIDTTDLISGDDGVNRDKTIDFSQLSITNTTVDQVTPSEFFIQTDLSNLSVSGTITIDGQEINLLPQSAGLNSPSVSGRLDVLLDDVNDPGTIQIVDSYIEVNPSGLARPDRGGTLDYSSLDLADFGLVGDQTFEITVPLSGTFDAEISLAIRDAIAQVISSRQVLDGSGNFDISEDWLLENGLLDSMVSVPSEGNGVFTTNSESTADETMSFFDPLTMAPTGLAAWSQANLTLVSPGIFELLIPISRRIEFTTEDGNDVVLNLVGSATARFNVNQDETDEAGDTLATAEVTGLTSAAPGTQVYQGIIGNNTVIADPLLDVDMFEIQLDAGDSVIVDIDANMFETGLDSVVRIFDSLGNQVAYSDNALAPDEFLVDQLAFPFDSYVSFTASSTGTYYIGVSAYNDSDDPSTYDPTNTAGRPTGVDPADVGSYDLTITVQEGVAPLHGTQAIEIDTTLDEGTTIDLVVVRTQTELDAFAQTTGLPASDTWIDEWSSFWVEVYVETADARGITDAAVDLNYNTNFFSATEIEFSRAFADSGQAVIDDTTGVVTGLSGTANYEKAGNGNKTLLARVKFESLAQDDVSIDFEDKFIGPHALGLSLSNVNVNLTNGSDTTLIVGDAPETDLWAIAYDVNDDDTINARDLVVLVTIYGQNVLDSDSPYVWALDADKSGTVDNRDLRYFVSNYGIQKGGDKDVVYPANFLQRWYGKTTDITGDSSIDQVMDEALGIWQDALGLAEPLDIQLVITNLGGTQLGEGQITGVDSEGRPVSGIVTLDDNAAGLGWYSDLDSSAFSDTDLEGGVAYTADAGSDAAGHYDLLTVLLHEIGHVLGFTETYAPFESFVQTGVGGTLSFVGSGFEATLTDDGLHLDDTVHAGDVMNATLDPGVRKLPSILDALILQSAHEAAASGSYEILVGMNAPLMANLPADEQLVAGNEPLMALESNTVVLSSNVTELNESVLPQFNLTRTQLNLNSSTLNQDELDLTVLEGLNDEQVSNLRLNGLSIVDSREHSPNSDAGQTETDSDLLGLTQEFDAEFDDVFSDWAGPIL
ncbi:beta strand repeat-containing protein [Gimesia fumaroli]|uniref:Uncharacterized protein n=1 Tax=Gimesia fumaroli TaxID=2527976 RepID=A0A518IFY6_9PLAN|nr:Ig-like domain-containing protein [Gimesia fumaroli]QDV52002.1 hypothetical protein Enr17x_40610 [Gimesia fumaroli]